MTGFSRWLFEDHDRPTRHGWLLLREADISLGWQGNHPNEETINQVVVAAVVVVVVVAAVVGEDRSSWLMNHEP